MDDANVIPFDKTSNSEIVGGEVGIVPEMATLCP